MKILASYFSSEYDTVVYRVSDRGVPHVVIGIGDTKYSICYFVKSETFRIFFPYPATEQTKRNFKTLEDLSTFLSMRRRTDEKN